MSRASAGSGGPWGWVALGLTVLLVAGSACWWGVGLTFGIVSGLVVLMAPAYPFLVQALVAGILVSLGLWRGWPRVGVLLALPVVTLPQLGIVGWYGWELWRCETAADRDACYAYLNGSVLLPVGVGGAVSASVVEVVVLAAVAAVAGRTGGRGPAGDAERAG